MIRTLCALFMIGVVVSCKLAREETDRSDTLNLPVQLVIKDSAITEKVTSTLAISKVSVNTGKVQPMEIIAFAKSLVGVPYKFGSTDPNQGFDCSGFITFVFNHFDIAVPRSSIDFTDVGRTVPFDSAKAGDLILFTGTDSTEQHVGHMGIVVANERGKIEFIHSTSGKAYGVTITPLSNYYMGRYVRTARIFKQNE